MSSLSLTHSTQRPSNNKRLGLGGSGARDSGPTDLFLLPSLSRGLLLLFLPRARDTSPNPSLGHALHDNPPTKPTHVHVNKHDIASRASGQRRVFSSRCAIFVRDGRRDGSAACFDKSYCRCFYGCEDERC